MEIDDIADLPFLQGLKRNDLNQILQYAVFYSYPPETVLFVEGQETDGLYLVLSGLIKVVKPHMDGREKTLAILRRGDVLGEMILFESTTRSATAETLEESTVMLISNENFKSLLLEIPNLAIKIIEVLSQRLRQANLQIQELMFYNAHSRLVFNLIRLASTHGIPEENGTVISLNLTHAELGNLVGASRETVTKLLDGLKTSGLIRVQRRKISILNLEELSRLANQGDNYPG